MLKELIGRYVDLAALKHALRLYSTYAFILIAGLPEIVPQLMAALPETLAGMVGGTSVTRYMQLAAVGGLVVRFLKQASVQAKIEAEARLAAEDAAAADEAGA